MIIDDISNIMHKTTANHSVITAVKSLMCALFICMIMSMTMFDAQSQAISEEIVRLHILANSDTEADQQLKLIVRDRVLDHCAEICSGISSAEQAEKLFQKILPQLVDEAQKVVYSQGYDYKVSGELCKMYFSTREYGDVTLPAGDYTAVRLTIGSGKGHNWWCVMFPPICTAASSADISDVLNERQTELVKDDRIQIKFKIYEIYEDLVSRAEKQSR